MFTGIVQGKAKIVQISGTETLKTFKINFPKNTLDKLQRGASIAINGACLTVTDFNSEDSWACFDVMNETLIKTNLSSLLLNDQVNFERAAKVGDEIGGHLMSGHIHTKVPVSRINRSKENCTFVFKMPSVYRVYLLEKGFVGLNGCSLTLGETNSEEFCVHLIPETLSVTTFDQLSEGNLVNLEIDNQTQCIVDTVEHVLQQQNIIGAKH